MKQRIYSLVFQVVGETVAKYGVVLFKKLVSVCRFRKNACFKGVRIGFYHQATTELGDVTKSRMLLNNWDPLYYIPEWWYTIVMVPSHQRFHLLVRCAHYTDSGDV